MTTTDDHGVDVPALTRPALARLLLDVRAELAEREEADRTVLEEKMRALATEAGFDPELVRMSTKRRGRPRKSNGHDETHDAGETT